MWFGDYTLIPGPIIHIVNHPHKCSTIVNHPYSPNLEMLHYICALIIENEIQTQ